MDDTGELVRKTEKLRRRLEVDVSRAGRRASGNYWTAFLLMIIAIGSSAFAGIASIAGTNHPKTIGVAALIPGVVALLVTSINFDARAMWQNRKKRELEALMNRFEFEMPSPPSADQIAIISIELSDIHTRMDKASEKDFALNWAWVSGGKKGK